MPEGTGRSRSPLAHDRTSSSESCDLCCNPLQRHTHLVQAAVEVSQLLVAHDRQLGHGLCVPGAAVDGVVLRHDVKDRPDRMSLGAPRHVLVVGIEPGQEMRVDVVVEHRSPRRDVDVEEGLESAVGVGRASLKVVDCRIQRLHVEQHLLVRVAGRLEWRQPGQRAADLLLDLEQGLVDGGLMGDRDGRRPSLVVAGCRLECGDGGLQPIAFSNDSDILEKAMDLMDSLLRSQQQKYRMNYFFYKLDND